MTDNNVCGIRNCVKADVRICFGIAWFASLEHAEEYAAEVKAKGLTYNGGFYHGMPCGRDASWDHVDEERGGQLYAVTF